MGRLLAREYLRSSTLKAALKIGMPAEPATTDTGKNGVQKTGTMRERERKKRRLGRRRRRKNTAKSSCIIQNSLQSSLMNKLESISNITCDCVCVCARARVTCACNDTVHAHHFTPQMHSFYTGALIILHNKCTHHFTPQVQSPFYTTGTLTILHKNMHSSFYSTSAFVILHHKFTHHFYTTSVLIT